ncbi:MAG: hypothetical protein ACREXJ_05615, partial [Gammaproteobacteria bacterium]
MGASAIMQFVLDHPQLVASLTFVD